MMLFIAIALILVGLLCFIYVSLNPNPSSGGDRFGFKSGSRSPRNAGSENEHLISRPNPRKGAEILASSKRAPSLDQIEKQKHLENLFVEGRRIPKQNRSAEPSSSYNAAPEYEEVSSIEEEFLETDLSSHSSHSGIEVLEESPKFSFAAEQKRPEEEVREIRFEIEGILYLDQGRELPYEKLANKKEELSPDKLKGLKRVGPGRLNESRDSLCFEALNSSYKYSFSEIEKILFFDEGIVLIPSKANYPVPVFFTRETNHLKSYLENSSQTFSK
ncbi:LIC_11490 family protein [Leptospira kmetyi]|uniref:LIC_11490 family protein n=1 Tax=Leptospira kmetyi TaxID=408139 RepID=UPI003EBD06DC